MPMRKIAITIDEKLVDELDRLVATGEFTNRSRAIGHALAEVVGDGKRNRLAFECAKLDKQEEQAFAEEGLEVDQWPEY